MTDVIILHRIPGARPGAILPLDERMKNHVAAGNARILPNEHDAWADEPGDTAPTTTPVLTGASTGSYSADEADADLRDATELAELHGDDADEDTVD